MFYIPMILDDLYYEKERLKKEKEEKKAKKAEATLLKKSSRLRKVQRERS